LNTSAPCAHIVLNMNSGQGEAKILKDSAAKVCAEFGYLCELYEPRSAQEMDDICQEALKKAQPEKDVVIAAGGDGTIQTLAKFAQGKKARIGAIPCGTFNYFTRTHGIPDRPLAALKVALTETAKPTRLAEVNGQVFIINASLGMYAKAIKDREEHISKFGRNRFVALLSTLLNLLSPRLLLKVQITLNDETHKVRTPMIFVGNNELQMSELAPNIAQCLQKDELAIVIAKPYTKWDALRMMFKGLSKKLDQEERITCFASKEVTIKSLKKTQLISLDGELTKMKSPLVVRARPNAVQMVRP